MKTLLAAILIIVGMSAVAYGQMLLLKVGPGGFGGGGAPPSSCDGTIDLSTGCVMPMLR